MGPPPSRRQFLAGLGGAVGLGAVGSTAYHAYTGPVDLVVANSLDSTVELAVRLSRDEEMVHRATYDVPARTSREYDRESPSEIPVAERNGSPGLLRDRMVETATRGTTYEFDAWTDGYGVNPNDEDTFTVTCTGYVEMSDGPLTDELLLFVPREPRERGMLLDNSHCGSLYNPNW